MSKAVRVTTFVVIYGLALCATVGGVVMAAIWVAEHAFTYIR